MKNLNIDWKELRREYEEDGTSIQDLSLKYSISTATVYAHSRVEKWVKSARDKRLRDGLFADLDLIEEDFDYDQDEYLVEVQRLVHERALFKAKQTVHRLLWELDKKTPQEGELDELWRTIASPESKKKILKYMFSFPSRCQAAKALAGAIKTLAEIERLDIDTAIAKTMKGKKETIQDAAAGLAAGKFAVPEIKKAA